MTSIHFVAGMHASVRLQAGGLRTQLLVTREPDSQVAHISFDIRERLRVTFVTVARRLKNKTRTAHVRVPVVIHEVMKA